MCVYAGPFVTLLLSTRIQLPYGVECGIDSEGHLYYIDHNTGTTSRKDPRASATVTSTLTEFVPPTPARGTSMLNRKPMEVRCIPSLPVCLHRISSGGYGATN